MSVPAGLLDDEPGVTPRLRVFTSSKAPWREIADDLPQHARWVEGYAPKEPAPPRPRRRRAVAP